MAASVAFRHRAALMGVACGKGRKDTPSVTAALVCSRWEAQHSVGSTTEIVVQLDVQPSTSTTHAPFRRRTVSLFDPTEFCASLALSRNRPEMRWSRRGAHLMLQTRTRVLDDTLRAKFQSWYPDLFNVRTPNRSEHDFAA